MKFIDKKAFKFVIVGVINTIVGTSVMFLLYNLAGASYWLSSASNYIIGSVVSYVLNKYFTFKNYEKSLGQVIRFIVNISLCYLLAYGIARPLAGVLLSALSVTIKENFAMLFGMGLFIVLNYIGQRFFVFKEGK